MPLTILLGLLLPLAEPVYAEWLETASTERGMRVYIDPAKIRRHGNVVKMWTLNDFKTSPTGAFRPYLSSKMHLEFDCAEERTRMLAYGHFANHMGYGKILESSLTATDWEPVMPDSVFEVLWKTVCEKK
jgi:hypothetical protein